MFRSATCATCTDLLDADAAFCGACGAQVRVRVRGSLAGVILDDRFRIDAKIAEGGFGAIYRATQLENGELVALKVLHADLASDHSLSARFRREGLALAALRDPHTVATYELGETSDGTLFIVMELLHGQSLLDRFVAQGRFDWHQMVSIAVEVCDSLVEAHALGIVHRDLKPANIHLERRGDRTDFVKLLDFGIAKLQPGSEIDDDCELTRTGQAIGTLEYMSPEQIVGGNCDERSDIYTLGVVLYEMITGRRPFADATGAAALITALLTETPPPPSLLCDRLPAALDRVLLRCLAGDPDDRYADVRQLATALEDLRSSVAYDDLDDEPTNVDAIPSAWARGSAVGITPFREFAQHSWAASYAHDEAPRAAGRDQLPPCRAYESIVRSDPARRRG